MNLSYNLGLFSKYRAELMGVATIMIIICHLHSFGVVMPNWMTTLTGSLGCGVDVFLFLSGFGMRHSFVNSRKRGRSILHWLATRYLRIICPLIILLTPFFIWKSTNNLVDVKVVAILFSGFGPLVGYGALWFIPCILLLYILTPALHFLLDSRWKWYWLVILSLCCYIYAYIAPVSSVFIFMVSRWPIYFLGYALSSPISKKEECSVNYLITIPLIVYVALYAVNHMFGSHFCLFGIQGILVVSVWAFVINRLKNRKLEAFMVFWGAISLESYITNEYVLRALQEYTFRIGDVDVSLGNWTFYVLGTIFCVVISIMANRLSHVITKIFA